MISSNGVLLRELTVKNYLFFNQCCTIDLSVTPKSGKNVVLIGGVNGAGKTTLLNGLKHSILGLNPDQASNLYSEMPVDEEMLFSLAFHWRGGEYRITRKYNRRNRFFRNSTLEVDGAVEREEHKIKESIETIFPPNLLDLFFFDVEEVKGVLTHAQVGEEIKDQIERLLGIELVRRARDDAKIILEESDTSRDGSAISVPHIQAEIEIARSELQDLLSRIQEAQALAQDLEQQLSQMPSSATAQKLEVEIEAKSREIEEAGQSIATLRDDSLKYINEDAVYEVLWPLIAQFSAEDQVDSEVAPGHLDRDVAIEALRSKNSELQDLGLTLEQAIAVIDLLSSYSSATLPEFQTIASVVEGKLRALEAFGNTALPLRAKLQKEVERRERLIQERERLQNELQRQLGDSAERTFRERYLEDTKDRLKRLLDQRTEIEERLKELDSKRVAAEKEGSERQVRKGRESLAQQYVLVFSKMLEIGRQRLVGRLGEVATEIFGRLDNDPLLYGEVRFDNNYHPYLMRGGRRWDPTNLSQGHQTVLAYSILAALMRLSGFSLPAVVDTPLMKLDKAHKSNVVEALYPSLSHQVVLFSSDEEIDADYYPALRPFVERSYVIRQRHAHLRDGVTKTSFVEPGYFDFEDMR